MLALSVVAKHRKRTVLEKTWAMFPLRFISVGFRNKVQ